MRLKRVLALQGRLRLPGLLALLRTGAQGLLLRFDLGGLSDGILEARDTVFVFLTAARGCIRLLAHGFEGLALGAQTLARLLQGNGSAFLGSGQLTVSGTSALQQAPERIHHASDLLHLARKLLRLALRAFIFLYNSYPHDLK